MKMRNSAQGPIAGPWATLLLAILILSLPFAVQGAGKDSTYKARPVVYAGILGMLNVAGPVMPSSQIQASLGLNIARIAKRNFVLGPMVEFNGFKALGSNWDYSNISDSIQAHYIPQTNPADAVRGTFLVNAFRSDSATRFLGCYSGSYGLIFSPFPDTYGGFMLQVKRGFNAFPISNFDHNPLVSRPEDDWMMLNIPIQYRIQILCKPLTLLPLRDDSKPHFLRKHVVVSLSYDRTSLRKATLDGAPLTRFLKPAFMDEYGGAGHFSIGIGLAGF